SAAMRDQARALRREQTDAESRLWQGLRARQIEHAKFRRQQPIGPFIADFCCLEHGLIVELDGSQHADADRARSDVRRTRFLAEHGYHVLRFWNGDVLKNTDAVVEQIATVLRRLSGKPSP